MLLAGIGSPVFCSRTGIYKLLFMAESSGLSSHRKDLGRFSSTPWRRRILPDEFVDCYLEKLGNSRENSSTRHFLGLAILVNSRGRFVDFAGKPVLRDIAHSEQSP